MKEINRLGGISGILSGVAFLVGMVLIVIPFVSAPAAVMDPVDTQARLDFIGSSGQLQRQMLGLGASLHVLAALFMLPAAIALSEALKGIEPGRAKIAASMASVGIPFFIIAQFEFFLLLKLSARYMNAGGEEMIALGSVHRLVEGITLIAEPVFWLFFGVGLVLFGQMMLRAGFSRWLVYIGFSTTGIALLAVLAGAARPELGAIGIISRTLLMIWLIWTGAILRRRT